jgi:sterol desaturase/sphingolipid hydroxylase (fatty acid hydroxylase superfamily)
MDLIALAVPFFLLALLLELIVDRVRGSDLYRANDAVNSLSAGTLSSTTGYFTKFIDLLIWGFVLENFALIDMRVEWFDASPRGIALWITAALAWDFCYYWAHRFGHEVSILWAAHAVHHQSEDYNLSTALRQTSTGFLFNWIFYLPLFVVGFPLEILITVNAVNLIYQFWVHTQVVDRMGALDRILVTPSNHRVHHAQNQCYIDKNYGGMLILWDRLFGTFEEERNDEPVIFGVRKPLANLNPFWANLQVYNYFEKFDPVVPRSVSRYVLAQFTVVIAAILGIGVLFAVLGAGAVLIPCLMLWATLYTLGLLNEGRDYASRFELLRLFVVVPAGAAAMFLDDRIMVPADVIAVAAGAYVVVSVIALYLSHLKSN